MKICFFGGIENQMNEKIFQALPQILFFIIFQIFIFIATTSKYQRKFSHLL